MRKKRFGWMPTLGTISNIAPGDEDLRVSFREFSLNVFSAAGAFPGGQGAINTLIFPVIPDAPAEGDTLQNDPQGALTQAMGNEWFCERIVGHLFLAYRLPDEGQIVPPSVIVTAGFFVARANDASSGGGLATPIGSASQQERNGNYSPVHVDAIREPWMWRRSWLLGGNPSLENGFSVAPTSNVFYGDIQSGPKIDVKSVRRIGQDDRLWFSVSTVAPGPPLNAETTFVGGLQGILDVRVLGNTRRAKNSGKF